MVEPALRAMVKPALRAMVKPALRARVTRCAGVLVLGLGAASWTGCAATGGSAPAHDAELAETSRLTQVTRLELQTQGARLAELEGQLRDLSEMLAWMAERDRAQDRALDSLRTPGAPARVQPAAPPGATTNRLSPDEATAYRAALDLYFARQYAAAVTAFQDLRTRFPGGAYDDNAEYWIGESHYGLGDYVAAQAAFERVLAHHPGSSKSDDAQLKLGYCHLKQGNTRRAGEEFRKLVSLYPSSEYVERARAELSRLGSP